MDDIQKYIGEYNPNKKRKILIVYDLIADILSNPIVTELFIKVGKLSISIAFITKSYFVVHKNIRLN